mgnify:CR=1 FL=1
MNYIVVDTSVLLCLFKNNTIGKRIDKEIDRQDDPTFIASTVTKGELESFVIQRNWGVKRRKDLYKFLEDVNYIDIESSNEVLINAYAKIDAFSKRKLIDPNGNWLVGSAHKMGKNDLWIAATAHVLGAPLMTTDGDFDHLEKIYLDVIKF